MSIGPLAQESPATSNLHGLAFDEHEHLQARVDRLERAVGTRRVVGQAQGILMERHDLSAEQALGQLRTMTQHTNRGLHDVAAELIRTRRERVPALRWLHPKEPI